MAQSYYFYDLETTGVDARQSRIMQFAGQRTDMDLNKIGEPDNILVKLAPDILPNPDAILVTGITPQMTLTDGITEAEFMKYFHHSVAIPNTIMVGFNNIRFDDEFIRFANYRNFYDAYEWQYADGRSKWDLLDLVRITRALRPEGIKWPVSSDGVAVNKLEDLAALNGLDHTSAHDALSDVEATIGLAKLIKTVQPKLYDYQLENRDKNKVAQLVNSRKPFVYTSGRYPGEYQKTTVVVLLGPDINNHGVLVYDLRIDPSDFMDKTPAELKLLQEYQPDRDKRVYFPVKEMRFNKCPAIAPIGVLNDQSWKTIGLTQEIVEENLQKLMSSEDFYDKLIASMQAASSNKNLDLVVDENNVDFKLYDGFFDGADKNRMSVVRAASANELADLNLDFTDDRLKHLLKLYKARNYPSSLDPSEQESWEKFRQTKLLSGGSKSIAAVFFKRLEELLKSPTISPHDKFLVEELRLYGESILPEPDL